MSSSVVDFLLSDWFLLFDWFDYRQTVKRSPVGLQSDVPPWTSPVPVILVTGRVSLTSLSMASVSSSSSGSPFVHVGYVGYVGRSRTGLCSGRDTFVGSLPGRCRSVSRQVKSFGPRSFR